MQNLTERTATSHLRWCGLWLVWTWRVTSQVWSQTCLCNCVHVIQLNNSSTRDFLFSNHCFDVHLSHIKLIFPFLQPGKLRHKASIGEPMARQGHLGQTAQLHSSMQQCHGPLQRGPSSYIMRPTHVHLVPQNASPRSAEGLGVKQQQP